MFPWTGKRQLLMQALDKSGCNRLLRMAGVWRGLIVLNYHRIGHIPHTFCNRDLWSVTQETLDLQIQFFKRHFDIIGLDDLPHVLNRETQPGRQRGRFVMFTFDDGYRDNYALAFPVLKSYGVSGCFFLTTGFLDHPHVPWWDEIVWIVRSSKKSRLSGNDWGTGPIEFDDPDRQQSVRQLVRLFYALPGHKTEAFLDSLGNATGSGRCPPNLGADNWLTWDMVREMRQAGMSFGGHTVNHPILANLTSEEQDLEIRECRLRIEQELGEQISAFSYPVGRPESFDEVSQRCLAKHNFRYAFSYYGGYNTFHKLDTLNIRRVAVEFDLNNASLHSMASLPQLFA